jgi:hypothetical protein
MPALCRGPVRGPSHRCKQCDQGHRRHGSVVSVQVVRTMHRAVLLIIRRSCVRAPPAPPGSPETPKALSAVGVVQAKAGVFKIDGQLPCQGEESSS